MPGQLRSLSELHPKFRPRVEQWLAAVEARGIDLLVVETRRTMAVAEAYFAQGRQSPIEINELRRKAGLRTIGLQECVRVITKAPPGMSWHIYGLAVDFVPMVGRVLDWNYDPDDAADYYDEIAEEAKRLGMTWGGDWRSFKDYPHVEWHPGWDRVADAYDWMTKNNNWQIPIAV